MDNLPLFNWSLWPTNCGLWSILEWTGQMTIPLPNCDASGNGTNHKGMTTLHEH